MKVRNFTYYRIDDDTVLDENNGRYCITEFPNGTYTYFTTISENQMMLVLSEIIETSFPISDWKKLFFCSNLIVRKKLKSR